MTAAREIGQVLSGARAKLSIGNTAILYATNVTYGEEIEYQPIEALDMLEIAEHVPVAYRVSFSSQHVRLVTRPIKNRDGLAIFPRLADILESGELTATVEDTVTGKVISNIQRCRASRYNLTIGAKGIVMTDVEWVAIRIKDESEIESDS